MTVYVESNFVLELALGQEQAPAAQAILERAERGEITLALPAFSLSEPFSTVTQRSRNLRRLARQLGSQLQELARSYPHEADVHTLESASTVFASVERRELQRLTTTVGRLLSVATIIPLNLSTYTEAMSVIERIALSPQDALIYAAVLEHLRVSQLSGPHLFISRNAKDFADLRIASELDALDCEFLGSFNEGALRLQRSFPD